MPAKTASVPVFDSRFSNHLSKNYVKQLKRHVFVYAFYLESLLNQSYVPFPSTKTGPPSIEAPPIYQ